MKKYLVLGVALIFFIVGCATLMANRERIVGTSDLAYEAVLVLAQVALDNETITQAEYEKIVDQANKFKKLIDVANEALIAYEKVESAENQEKLDVAMIELIKILPEIQSIIKILRE